MSPEQSAGSFVGIDTLVEGFMTDGRLAFDLKEPGNLLRAPLLGQLGFGKSPGRRIDTPAVCCGPHAGHSKLMRLLRSIAPLAAVAGQFTADRGFVAVHQGRDGARFMAGCLQDVDLISFVMGEMCVVHSRQL